MASTQLRFDSLTEQRITTAIAEHERPPAAPHEFEFVRGHRGQDLSQLEFSFGGHAASGFNHRRSRFARDRPRASLSHSRVFPGRRNLCLDEISRTDQAIAEIISSYDCSL